MIKNKDYNRFSTPKKMADEAHEVKANADHEALTHIANQLDKLLEDR